jgi:hypothetical protein
LFDWFSKALGAPGGRSPRFYRPSLEALEDRYCPANTWHWNGPAGGGNWSDPGNWKENNGNVPVNGDTVIFDNTTSNDSTDNIANLSLASLQLTSDYGGYVLLKTDLGVTGNVSIADLASGGLGKDPAAVGQPKLKVPNAASTFTWSGGTIKDIEVDLGSAGVSPTLTINGDGIKTLGANATFDSYASATWSGSNDIAFDGATFKNESGGTFDVTVDRNITGTGSFLNYGTFKKSAGLPTLSTTISPTFSNAGGQVTFLSGTTTFDGGFGQSAGTTTLAGGNVGLDMGVALTITGGVLTGAGTITGDVVNGGTVTLPATGQLNIGGNYTQQATGTLVLNISASGGCGTLSIQSPGGNANLAGTLTVNRDPGYTPVNGTYVQFLTFANTGSGTFTTENIPNNSWNAGGVNNLGFHVVYSGTSVYLVVSP